jgi:hypothetical protein
MEHMKDFHSIKVDPHQKGFGNLPDGCQQLLKACQIAERDYMKDSHGVKAGPHQKGFDNLPDGLPTIAHGFLVKIVSWR